MTLLTAQNLGVTLAGRTVLTDVSLSLSAGHLVALVGPNGAGKTTLLRAIAGLVPSAGAVHIRGDALAALPLRERAKRFAYLPQGHVVHWPLPARDMVLLWTALTHRAGGTAAALIAWLWQQAGRADVVAGADALTGVPDPSVASATPLPMILGGRTAWSSILMRRGQRDQFHALRRVLQRPELLLRHAPWWLIESDQAEEVVQAFATACRLVDQPPRKSNAAGARRPALPIEAAGAQQPSPLFAGVKPGPSRHGEAP
jgi:hypothetical protein